MARSKQPKPIGRVRLVGRPAAGAGPTMGDARMVPRLNPTVRRKRRMRPGTSFAAFYRFLCLVMLSLYYNVNLLN